METNETTPDQLLRSFEGRSLKSIIVFTIVVHAVILIGTSIPSLVGSMMGEDISDLSPEERLEAAAEKAKEALAVIDEERDRDANAATAKIAEMFDVKPQDLGDRLQAGAPKAAPDPVTPSTPEEAPATDGGEPEKPKSEIEKEIEKVAPGPEMPPVEDEEEDLFK
jgi:hypothetical protein